MSILFHIACVVLWAMPAFAQVTFQASASSSNTGSGGTVSSLTYSHTVSTGTNRGLYVGSSNRCVTSCPTSQTVTFNGESLSQLATVTVNNNDMNWLFFLAGATETTANVVVTPSNAQRISSGAINLVGVDQSTPNGTAVTNENGTGQTTMSCVITVPTNGAGVGSGAKNNSTEVLVTATQTERYAQATTNATDTNNTFNNGATTESTGSQTFTFTSATGRNLSCIAVAVNPAAAAAVTPARRALWFR